MKKTKPYFDLPGVNSSILGWLLPESGGSEEMFTYMVSTTPKDLEGSAIDIGSALHMFIENPDEFKITVVEYPGPAAKRVIDAAIADEEVKTFDYLFEDKIFPHIEANQYYPALKRETRVKKIIEEGNAYFNAIRNQKEFEAILSAEDAKTVEIGMNVLSKKAARIFAPRFHYASDDEVCREYVIECEMGGVQCKALIDRLVINHRTRTYRIEDLKTTSTLLPFFFGYSTMEPKDGGYVSVEVKGELFNRQIHRQMAFYEKIVKTKFPGYMPVANPLILALETVPPFRYQEFEIPTPWLTIGEDQVKTALETIRSKGLLTATL